MHSTMEIPRTQRLANEFDERNVVLQLALGGLGLGARLDAFLDRWAAPGSSAAGPKPVDLGEAAVVDFLLGLVAFREHFERVVGRHASQSAPDQPDAHAGEDVEPRELLR